MLSCSTFDFFVKTLHDLSKFFFDTRMKPAGSPEREEFSYDNLLAPIRFIGEVVIFFSGATMMSATFKFVDIVYRFVIVFWFISYQLKTRNNNNWSGILQFASKTSLQTAPPLSFTRRLSITKLNFSPSS